MLNIYPSPVLSAKFNPFFEVFEKQAVESATQKPKIQNHYIDDTFTILDCSYVDCFLQYLNSQQPTIQVTLKTEKDNKITFLYRSVMRKPDRCLTTSVHKKFTHTFQYLAYDSHHPQSVKRSIVKCLFDQGKHLMTKLSIISRNQFLFPMVIPLPLYRRLRRQETPPQAESL